ncbi:myb-like DNA-binding protein bas1, partial [Coemansia biformis]
MDVAELRQAMLGFVRQHRSAGSLSPTLATAHAMHAASPPSPNPSSSLASTSSLVAPGRAGDSELACKRHNHDSGASSLQRIGIDLLLNASTISDRMDCSDRHLLPASQLPSPPTHARRSPSPVQLTSLITEVQWQPAMRKRPALPPISHMAQSPPAILPGGGPASPPLSSMPASYGLRNLQPAPADSSFKMEAAGAQSLEAYRVSGVPMRAAPSYSSAPSSAYAHSFPPPLSTARSQLGIAHHPSPPGSQENSPVGLAPSQGPQSVTSPTRTLPIPVPTTYALPPASDTVTSPDLHRSLPSYARSPTMRAGQHAHPRQYHPYPPPQPPAAPHQLQPAPPMSPHSLYAQAQGYFAHRAPSPPQPRPVLATAQPTAGVHQQQVGPAAAAAAAAAQQQQHLAGVHLTSPGSVQMSMARNVSKPKFNYAFLDTKRPRGPSSRWTPDEDRLLKRAVKQFGEDRQWVKVAQQVPGRTNLQCRQRWLCNIKAQ